MFDILAGGFKEAKQKLQGIATLNEENVKEAISLIRRSLLEADVEYTVTRSFLKELKKKL